LGVLLFISLSILSCSIKDYLQLAFDYN
jgi:hypothetical protein